jgi:hypothetical protein
MKIKYRIKKIIFIIAIAFLALIFGLIFNNRICYLIFSGKDTTSDQLSEADKEAVYHVYDYLKEKGGNLFGGFNNISTDLIIFNEKYEFLFSGMEEEKGWERIEYNAEMGRNIFRREVENSEAFAVKVNGRWVGSFDTKATFNKEITKVILPIFPPQLFMMDEEYYRGTVIHEMVHAFEGNLDNDRVDAAEHIHNLCSKYYNDANYEKRIKQEAYYLKKAMDADNHDDIIKNVKKFIEKRKERRLICNLSDTEINNEKELEWLEGLARYAEYYAAKGSSKAIVKNLRKIEEKAAINSDERYYVLGMAQAMVLDKLSDDWKTKVLTGGYTLEECLIAQ